MRKTLVLASPSLAVSPELTPTPTETITPTPTVIEEVLAVSPTPTPVLAIQPPQGIEFRELIFIAIICLLILIIILQVYLGGEKEENL